MVEEEPTVFTSTTSSGARCTTPNCGPNFFTQVQGIGILAVEAAPGSVFSRYVITGNDVGFAQAFGGARAAR